MLTPLIRVYEWSIYRVQSPNWVKWLFQRKFGAKIKLNKLHFFSSFDLNYQLHKYAFQRWISAGQWYKYSYWNPAKMKIDIFKKKPSCLFISSNHHFITLCVIPKTNKFYVGWYILEHFYDKAMNLS